MSLALFSKKFSLLRTDNVCRQISVEDIFLPNGGYCVHTPVIVYTQLPAWVLCISYKSWDLSIYFLLTDMIVVLSHGNIKEVSTFFINGGVVAVWLVFWTQPWPGWAPSHCASKSHNAFLFPVLWMGTIIFNAQRTLRWTSIPCRREQQYNLLVATYRNYLQISLGLHICSLFLYCTFL